MTEQSADLAALRAQLDGLDRTLLQTAANRAEVVKQIALAKAGQRHPLFDRARERQVFEKAERVGNELGLDPQVARGLMAVQVEASHRIQERAARQVDRASGAGVKHLAIVGGRGQMGQLFARAFEERGHRVTPLDVEDDLTTHEAVSDADVVMIAVPMSAAVGVIRVVAPRLKPDALLCDINSLKAEVCEAMAASATGETLGLHPMFGPSVRSLRRQKVVVCPLKAGPMGDWLTGELGRLGFELIEAEPDAHDRMMAVIQVLVHFSTIVMGEALRETGTTVEDSLKFTSPIYRLELAFVGRLFAQDPELYAEICMANPHSASVRRTFLNAANAVDAAVESGDRESFSALFASVHDWFHGFGEEAMALSDFIIEALVTRP
ncbi:MAG: chorismate mutase/prephenate dehydrogenase [Myxococcota bacterium]|jgi:chorismate mutase/prephenate dehydrogenase